MTFSTRGHSGVISLGNDKYKLDGGSTSAVDLYFHREEDMAGEIEIEFRPIVTDVDGNKFDTRTYQAILTFE